jgi:hypothetical protein
MRKVLTWIGGATLLILVIGVGGFIALAVQGSRLDTEARLYADGAVRPVVSPWNVQALTERAAPELLANTKPQQLTALFQWLKTLGALKDVEPCGGQTRLDVNTSRGRTLTGQYTCRAQFQGGQATIEMLLVKRSNAWRIAGFHVTSPALLPSAQTEKT